MVGINPCTCILLSCFPYTPHSHFVYLNCIFHKLSLILYPDSSLVNNTFPVKCKTRMRLWLSRQRGRLQHQRSEVWLQFSANFYIEHLFPVNWIEKTKIKRNDAGNGPFWNNTEETKSRLSDFGKFWKTFSQNIFEQMAARSKTLTRSKTSASSWVEREERWRLKGEKKSEKTFFSAFAWRHQKVSSSDSSEIWFIFWEKSRSRKKTEVFIKILPGWSFYTLH